MPTEVCEAVEKEISKSGSCIKKINIFFFFTFCVFYYFEERESLSVFCVDMRKSDPE